MPFIGVAANLADAAIYAYIDEDYFMASLSLVGALTMGASGVVALAAKGSKLARGAQYVYTAGMFVSNTMNFAKNSMEVYDIGSMMWQKYVVEGQTVSRQTFVELRALGFVALGSIGSAVGMAMYGKELYGMMKADGVFAKIGQGLQRLKLDNRGMVNLDALVGKGSLGTESVWSRIKNKFKKKIQNL